jgi:hypothetical protein
LYVLGRRSVPPVHRDFRAEACVADKFAVETIRVPQRSFELNSTRIFDTGATETVVLRVGRFDETTQTGEGALRNVADGEASTIAQRPVVGQEHWFGNGSTDPVQWTGMSLATALDAPKISRKP